MDSHKKKVSVVLCTYNGERFLRQQLDTVVKQTYPLYEIIIQDDGSTDATWTIIEEYSKKHANIKAIKNTGPHGVNQNFFSAMFKATGDYIAICDQDDIWELSKIEKMMAVMGESLLCTGRSCPFSEDGQNVEFDARRPNYHTVRLLFSSILGHTMLFRRELLNFLPPEEIRTNYSVYDDTLGLSASLNGSISICNEVLVHQRRYAEATTVSQYDHDPRRTPSLGNGLYILWWSVRNYGKVRKAMAPVFTKRCKLLKAIPAPDTTYRNDALRILELEGNDDFLSYIRLTLLFLKHRHHLFFAEGKGIVNWLRALLFPLMQTYNYRGLLDHHDK